jgi:hypothetical protein
VLKNTTAATSGNQTWSPSVRLTGNQFASGASRTSEFLATLIPVEQNFDHSILRLQTKHGSDALVNLLDIRNYNGECFIERQGNINIGSSGANGNIFLQYNGVAFAILLNGASPLSKDLHLAWTDAATPYGTKDSGVVRGAAGVVKVTNGSTGYGIIDASALRASGTKVVGSQGAAVADAAGGAVVDTEARTALNALLSRIRDHGLIAA